MSRNATRFFNQQSATATASTASITQLRNILMSALEEGAEDYKKIKKIRHICADTTWELLGRNTPEKENYFALISSLQKDVLCAKPSERNIYVHKNGVMHSVDVEVYFSDAERLKRARDIISQQSIPTPASR